MKLARRVHLLLGVFFAPAIMFYAITGAMQVIGLQQRREGRTPAEWVVHVVEVHEHQKWEPRRRAAPPAGAPQAPREEPAKSPGTMVLQGFSVLMALGLTIVTVLGLWMAWQLPKDRRLATILFAAGCVLPAGTLFF